MKYDNNSRTFKGKLSNIPEGKRRKLASIEVDCGEAGIAIFRLLISRSPKDNPQVTIRSKKPKTGEFKVKMLMAVPVAPAEEE